MKGIKLTCLIAMFAQAIFVIGGCGPRNLTPPKEQITMADYTLPHNLTPSKEQMAMADYGLPLTKREIEVRKTLFEGLIASDLKDPGSAIFEWLPKPEKSWMADKKRVIYGYMFTVFVNAKNSYGGYTGSKSQRYLVYKEAEGKGKDDANISNIRMIGLCIEDFCSITD